MYLLRLRSNGGSVAGSAFEAALTALAALIATLVAAGEEAVPVRFDFGAAFSAERASLVGCRQVQQHQFSLQSDLCL